MYKKHKTLADFWIDFFGYLLRAFHRHSTLADLWICIFAGWPPDRPLSSRGIKYLLYGPCFAILKKHKTLADFWIDSLTDFT